MTDKLRWKLVIQTNNQNVIKEFFLMSRWNITENIATEIGQNISSDLALSRNIEKIHIAVLLSIAQYELVCAPEFAGIVRCKSA